MPLKILITGGGGYIGGWIAETIYRRGADEVRVGIRSMSGAARIARFPVDIVPCNVLDTAQLEAAMKGITHVIHCAVGSRDVTVTGTANVLAAAAAHNVKRIVHISTIDVYGVDSGVVEENTPRTKTGSDYGDPKIEAEELCEAAMARGQEIVIIRPTVVYGPYNKLWVLKFAERLQSKLWSTFDKFGDGDANLVYVTDLVDAVLLSLDSNKAAGQAFNINGPEVTTWNDYFIRFNALLGLPPLRSSSPGRSELRSKIFTPIKSIARTALKHFGPVITFFYQRVPVVQKMMKAAEVSMATTPGNAELRMFAKKAVYPSTKAVSLLGYTPKVGVREGLEMNVRWLAHETMFTTIDRMTQL
jgi:nucleoside-diphosphate-sugar epimerase